MIGSLISIVQMVLSVLLIIVILLQQKGSGLGAAFGGSGGSVHATRRGVDKVLHQATVVISILFFVISFINLFV